MNNKIDKKEYVVIDSSGNECVRLRTSGVIWLCAITRPNNFVKILAVLYHLIKDKDFHFIRNGLQHHRMFVGTLQGPPVPLFMLFPRVTGFYQRLITWLGFGA